MSLQKTLKSILTPICSEVWANVRGGGTNKSLDLSADYIVYVLTDNRPELWGDDAPIEESFTVRVNYFTKNGTKVPKKRKQIRAALESAGYIWQTSLEMYENDTGYTHLIVEAETRESYDNTLEG